jgi:hypothetical protein
MTSVVMTPDDAMSWALHHTNVEGGAAWLDVLGFRYAREAGLVFAVDDGTRRMLIVPVEDPWSFKLVDVLAIDPAQPSDIHYMTGEGIILGNPMMRTGTVRIHRYVSSWLGNVHDICLLKPIIARFLYCGLPRLTLRCDDRDHGLQVLAAFQGVEGITPAVIYIEDEKAAA